MTFWLDAQLDSTLPAWLGSQFKVIVKTVAELGLRDADDIVLFDAGRRFNVSGSDEITGGRRAAC